MEKFNRYTLGSTNNNVCNLTKVELPTEVKSILNLEPKFAIETNINNMKYLPTIIKDVEYGIAPVRVEHCDTAEENIIKNNLRSTIINIVSNFCKKKEPSEKHKIIGKNLLHTQRFLKYRHDLIVARSDNGYNTAIML